MCGIVGYVGSRSAIPVLLEGLRRLEYRGYDSAGVAIVRANKLAVYKSKGKVREVAKSVPKRVRASVGIGHTRWATHGEPNDRNAHPHVDAGERIAIVHNGIIENAHQIRRHLEERGIVLASDTDSELLAHLIAVERESAPTLADAVRRVLKSISGAYGLCVVDRDEPGQIVVARNGSPAVIGIGDGEMFVASDSVALVRHTTNVVYLDDGDVATVRSDGYEITDFDASPVERDESAIETSIGSLEKDGFDHFMLKEIADQPDCIQRTLRGRVDERFNSARLDGLNLSAQDLLTIRRIKILGCGSAYISGLIGGRLIEQLARVPVDAEPAAEFRYRNAIIEPDTLYLAVSQSGETYDTQIAVEEIKRKGGTVRGIVNAVGSSIARTCDGGVYLHAGPEISVVATKTFLSTLTVFVLIGLFLGRMRDMSPGDGERLTKALADFPALIGELVRQHEQIEALARKYVDFKNAYFIGRNLGYGMAMEGALKLKEVSYLHAEAYPASELKHGPLALVSPETVTVALIPDDDLIERNLASIEEIKARRGPVVAITQVPLNGVTVDDVITVPTTHPALAPLAMLIPLQILAYYVALHRGCDIDQPRNLAKSVTVE